MPYTTFDNNSDSYRYGHTPTFEINTYKYDNQTGYNSYGSIC